MSTGRLEAFSDGVIAIIITITVLLIDLPEGDTLQDLTAILPLILCYLVSFILVGVNWVNHHHLLQVTQKVDGRILWANLLYLFVLSFIPVATGWVGRSGFAVLPVRVYVIINLAGTCSYILLQQAIVHSHDCVILKQAVNESRKELWTAALECAALAVTFISGVHYISVALLVIAVAPWVIPDLRMKRVFEASQEKIV